MNFRMARQDLIKGVQTAFNKAYPFLRIEFSKKGGLSPDVRTTASDGVGSAVDTRLAKEDGPEAGSDEEEVILATAGKLLWEEFGVSDEMKVSELEILLQYQFSLPVQILRKSANLWMETRSSRDWTLRQHNSHGEDLSGPAV